MINKRRGQVLSVQDKKASVMDLESFETIDVPLPTNKFPVVYDAALVPPELNPNTPVTAVVGILIAVFVTAETRP